jgi:hypothetical protein
MSDIETSYREIKAQIDEFRRLVRHRDAASEVSDWSVGMHVHHCGLAMSTIAESLIECDEPAPPGDLSPRAVSILARGQLPRGVAKAPDIAIPTPGVDDRTLKEILAESEERLNRLPPIGDRCWFRHFALGVLVKRNAVRFMSVHNAHHLAIVAEILGRPPCAMPPGG